jgi:uncharacterized protein (DUF305 family)
MKRSKTLAIVLSVVAVVGLAGAGAFAYLSKDDAKPATQTNSASQDPMAGMDHSMNSMNAELMGLTGDAFDEKFLTLMVEHHAGAVDMATYVDTEAKHAEIRQLAQNITADQNKEISQMRDWAKQWRYSFTEPKQASVTAMSQAMKGLSGDELDKQFITDMSIHHNGAIEMAQLALTNAKHQELKDFAQRIIDAQSKEITDMNTWAVQWGYQLEDNENNPHATM